MIAVTDEARALARSILATQGTAVGGLRIVAVPPPHLRRGAAFELVAAEHPEPHDRIEVLGDLRLFIDPVVAASLAGGQLAVEDGRLVVLAAGTPGAEDARDSGT